MEREQFIAEIRHIAWIAFQIAVGQPYNEKTIKDQMDSLINGVEFADKHPLTTPKENHENWMKTKLAQGWMYGPTKDFEKKTHPNLVSYDQLPEIEKRKDISELVVHRLADDLWNRVWR